MRRYWIEQKAIGQDGIRIEGDLFHHICVVCRHEVGDRFEMVTDGDRIYLVELKKVGKREALAIVMESPRYLGDARKPLIHLALGISRFPVMDDVVEKMVELGVTRLLPVCTERCFSKDRRVLENRRERWERIVLSASRQCGRGHLMEVSSPQDLSHVLTEFNQAERTRGLFAYEGQEALAIKDFLREPGPGLAQGSKTEAIWLFVGSEGGFTDGEVSLFSKFSLSPVTMGREVLRVETACVALIGIIKYEFDLMRC